MSTYYNFAPEVQRFADRLGGFGAGVRGFALGLRDFASNPRSPDHQGGHLCLGFAILRGNLEAQTARVSV